MDYFDELEKNFFIYDEGRPCICQNKKGEFISAEFIKDVLDEEIERHRKNFIFCKKNKNEKLRYYAKFEIEDIMILENIKVKLLSREAKDDKKN